MNNILIFKSLNNNNQIINSRILIIAIRNSRKFKRLSMLNFNYIMKK